MVYPATAETPVAAEVQAAAEAPAVGPADSVPKPPDILFHIWAFAALAKAFAGNEFGQNPRGCGLNLTRAGLVPLRSSKPKHQPTTDPGSAPGRAAQHSLRLLQETSLGKTLAAVGSTPAGLVPLRFSKPGAHGLAADLATGAPTGPPGIKNNT